MLLEPSISLTDTLSSSDKHSRSTSILTLLLFHTQHALSLVITSLSLFSHPLVLYSALCHLWILPERNG